MPLASSKRRSSLRTTLSVLGETLVEIAKELRTHARRITRLEAKWETAIEIAATRGRPRRVDDES